METDIPNLKSNYSICFTTNTCLNKHMLIVLMSNTMLSMLVKKLQDNFSTLNVMLRL